MKVKVVQSCLTICDPMDCSLLGPSVPGILQVRIMNWVAFPHSSVGKESACNAGDPSSIPGSGRYPGEGIGYPLSILGLPLWLSW